MSEKRIARPVSLDITVSADTYDYLEFTSTRTALPLGMVIDRLVQETRTNRPETAARQTLEQALSNFTALDDREIREALHLLQSAFENVLQRAGTDSRMWLLKESLLLSRTESRHP